MRAWQFSKPKTPGFGISKGYYLSVLSSHATLPPIRELINPAGTGGAATGFGVPLAAGAEKADLDRPMGRGAYTIASKDQKTVLRLTVVSKEEARFDPEAVARSFIAAELGQEALARIRATWTLCEFTFESHHPMVYPALDFLLALAARLAILTEGMVADAVGQRYLLPDQVFSRRRMSVDLPVFAEEHISPKFRWRSDGIQAYTLGMQKFGFPELEIVNLMDGDESSAALALLWLAQAMLQGAKVREGYEVGDPKMPFEVRDGGFDKALWEGISVYELLPPTTVTATEAIQAWAQEIVGLKAQ
ncbi:MAG TPA: hypothetical protein VK934_12650 [Fimbriimonas sp.]|nr:hypothetical protein [Fimbriimonas sp.]